MQAGIGPAVKSRLTILKPRLICCPMNDESTPEKALFRAKAAVGGQAKLAAALGITSQAISQWQVVPLARIKDVARVTGLTIQELRPDLFQGAGPDPKEAA